jgi:glycosyltransferase involved in cell wall biosynthesis
MQPSLTLVLLSYNQERYLRAALDAAFAQTHSPLEILISDDCSTDNSRQIIEQAVSAYSGPHTVRMNFNPVNLRTVNHINRVFSLARGEFVALAACDDISLPNRMAEIAAALAANPQPAFGVFSDATAIDENGKVIGPAPGWRTGQPLDAATFTRTGGVIGGAAACYSRAVIDVFGEMDPQIWAEDSLLPFRALLLGEGIHLAKPLVLYRRHGASMTHQGQGHRDNIRKVLTPMVAGLQARLADLKHPVVAQKFSPHQIETMCNDTERGIAATRLALALNEKSSSAILRTLIAGVRGQIAPKDAVKMVAMFRMPGLWRTYAGLRGGRAKNFMLRN